MPFGGVWIWDVWVFEGGRAPGAEGGQGRGRATPSDFGRILGSGWVISTCMQDVHIDKMSHRWVMCPSVWPSAVPSEGPSKDPRSIPPVAPPSPNRIHIRLAGLFLRISSLLNPIVPQLQSHYFLTHSTSSPPSVCSISLYLDPRLVPSSIASPVFPSD